MKCTDKCSVVTPKKSNALQVRRRATPAGIAAADTHLISAIFVPPLPMMQPMSSLGTVIS